MDSKTENSETPKKITQASQAPKDNLKDLEERLAKLKSKVESHKDLLRQISQI